MVKDIYFKQARLVLQLLPFVMKHDHFALKGGSAINFFVRDLPRLSIDIDLTYIPLENRMKSIGNISNSLEYISRLVKKAIRNTRIVPKILRGIIKSCGRRKFENEVPYAKIKQKQNLIYRRHTAHERFYQKLH